MEAVNINFKNITGGECTVADVNIVLGCPLIIETFVIGCPLIIETFIIGCPLIIIVLGCPLIIETFDGDGDHTTVLIDNETTDGHDDGDTAPVNSGDDFDDDLVVGNEDKDGCGTSTINAK